MRILHVIPSVSPLRGGPSFVIRAMSEGLAAHGCDIDVAATDDNGPGRLPVPLGQAVCENGVTYRYFPRQTRFYTVSWPLSRWLRENVRGYDLLHIHALFSFSVASAAYWSNHYRVPYVVRPLGTLNRWGMEKRRPFLKQASLRLIDGRVLSNAAALHYTSRKELEEGALVTNASWPVVIPNPVNFQVDRGRLTSGWLPSRFPSTAGKKVILFLSRLDPVKGIDLLLASFARLRPRVPDAVLVIGGSGDPDYLGQIQRQARELDLGADVVWAGFLEGEEKKSALAEADLFVLPSYSENFGLAALEAMAARMPVIVSDRVGVHREIAAAEAGLVVPCEEEALTDALYRGLSDGDLRTRLARNGAALAGTFSRDAVADQLVDLYRKIVAANGAGK